MEDYFENLSSLKQRLQGENPFLVCSGEDLFAVVESEFNAAVVNAPSEIYGNWDWLISQLDKLSEQYFNPDKDHPLTLVPGKILEQGWADSWQFIRYHHYEFLWFAEKNRFLLSGVNPAINLNHAETRLRQRADFALQRGDRERAFSFLHQIVSRFPDDFTVYVDLAFLYLNDRQDIASASVNMRNACKVLFQRTSYMHCFLTLMINMLSQIEDDYFTAYSVTRTLLPAFSEYGEVIFQHGVNALRLNKRDEGLHYIELLCKQKTSYALKVYDEFKDSEFYKDIIEIFIEVTNRKRDSFDRVHRQSVDAIEKAKRLGLERWGKDVLESIAPDLEIIDSFANSGTYAGIMLAEFFTRKTPEIMINKARHLLLKAGNRELEENEANRKAKKEEFEEIFAKLKNVNSVGVRILPLIAVTLFVLGTVLRGISFGFTFSATFSLLIVVALAINTFNINKIKGNAEKDLRRLELESKAIVTTYSEEIEAFTSKIESVLS